VRQHHIFLVPAVILALTLSGCSGDDGKGETEGRDSASVCGAFAERADVASALRDVTGTNSFTEDRSKPDETLQSLRSADGELEGVEILGSPYCWLRSADGGEDLLAVNFREGLAVIEATADREKRFTFYRTGESAFASEDTAVLYFRCRMNAPAKEVLIHADLERLRAVDISDAQLSCANIHILNAVARQVATELGCSSPGLGAAAPRPVSGLHA